MDCSDNGFSSSTPIIPSAIPKSLPSDAGETKENDLNHEKIDSKLHNRKKLATKHFMSPTISASSKATVPKKKILSERNEVSIFSDTHLTKIPNLDSKSSPFFRQSYSSASEVDDDEQSTYVADSSLKPYDPLTNYLSPRPRYLRYKPNRRSKIFLHQENEIREGNHEFDFERSVSFDSQKFCVEEESLADASDPSSKESSDEEKEKEKVEEIEEFEEERGWGFRGVLEFLLVLLVLFLSTLYISTMNSPTPSPTQQPISGLQDGYYKIQNFEAISMRLFGSGGGFLKQLGNIQMSVAEMNQSDINSGFERELITEDDRRGLIEMGEVVEQQNGHRKDVCDHELEKKDYVSDQSLLIETADNENVCDHEFETKEEEGPDKFLERVSTESEELENKGEASGNEGIVDLNAKDDEIETDEIREMVEVEEKRVEDTVADTNSPDSEMDKEYEGFDTNSPDSEAEVSTRIIDNREIELILVTGVSLFFAILLSLAFIFSPWEKKASIKEPLPNVEEEEISQTLPNVEEEEEEEEHIMKVESFPNPPSFFHLKNEVSKEFSHTGAPTVELLGEIVVGEVSKMIETEVSKSTVSHEKGSRIKAHIDSTPPQPSVLELSTMDSSPSYGSFTAEKKILNKEERKDQVKMVITTPVRRSSRIRSRGVMSP